MTPPSATSPRAFGSERQIPRLSTPRRPRSDLGSQNGDSQAADSVTYSPCSDKEDNALDEERYDVLPGNPFDSESSRILFDAIDRLQSCGVGQELAIPQLVIVGGQSAGKSSLLQSPTDIPFPVGKGCCTRFATRIVSRRTAPGSTNAVKITIVDPEVTDIFGYPPDDAYKRYSYVSDRLGAEEFGEMMENISASYMGIKPGQGSHTKNFATQVLRIELSGPSRSHFSILDVPGIIAWPRHVNEYELHGVKKMVEEYMREPANIVICVAAATADLETQEIFNMAAKLVDKKRLVGVFTKCDRLDEGGEDSEKAMQGGWFVVRNRSELDDDDFDVKEAERKLFDQPPWDKIRRERRCSSALQEHLGKLLCAQIRGNFPVIQESVRSLLSDAESSRRALGDPRLSHSLRQQYIRDVVERYHATAVKTLKSPGSLSDEALRVRGLVREANELFTAEMHNRGHTHLFEDPDADPMTQLANAPPIKPLVEEIGEQLRIWQTTELPGLVNTEVIQVLYRKQSENWQRIAEYHIDCIANDIETASNWILEDACSPACCSSILYQELSRVLTQLQQQAKKKAVEELKEYCRRERASHLQTTDSRFEERLQALRTVRLLNSLGSIPPFTSGNNINIDHAKRLFRHFHHSSENNMIYDVHDVVKVYYQLSLEAFIRYITNDIVEDFISYSEGPLMGLSTDWVLKLSEEDVEKLAREDEETLHKRAHYDLIVEKLKTAHEIAENARMQTRNVGHVSGIPAA
ncbi:vacuolar sorting protein VPS1 [Colletotrichum higginsianum]|uniref:Vacuolar sorting protein VPS1 n=1 Tax=Colletotrichum higginsianum (strain IMI 349063) TaxID=759273 RepID=H1VW27_COLHI|nr:vacuolar sorting protein VPS1 [Colletotrichum higginsianum]